MSKEIIKDPLTGTDLIRVRTKKLCDGCFFHNVEQSRTCNSIDADKPAEKGTFWCTKLIFGKLYQFIYIKAF